ncbi:hypothetical protein M408DRAFT_326152 [Serendipita vermifera MAFF 305830]|uniref:Uncharacterized protein n=1 Tax=Serendipita vermifera MAFF 305830 TaxID=933852 RepID=A0A0C3B9D7_SERVB|nr:hypothetical protein M408DRAFT_326152 [Serendipita vermifera MAFF 305830]
MHDRDGISGSRSVGLVDCKKLQSDGESISRSRNAAAGSLQGATLNHSIPSSSAMSHACIYSVCHSM